MSLVFLNELGTLENRDVILYPRRNYLVIVMFYTVFCRLVVFNKFTTLQDVCLRSLIYPCSYVLLDKNIAMIIIIRLSGAIRFVWREIDHTGFGRVS